MAASIARSLAPAEASSPCPAWLLETQLISFRRVLAAVRRFQGALLADPVGTGKTYISLAVAAAVNGRRPTTCLVPAPLLSQWRAVAAALDVPVVLCSHQQASRGRLPADTKGLVIIDESHNFRNRMTRRYTNVAAWLVRRPALLVTATPVVNRVADLGNQLLLAVRDNALAVDGIPSLRSLLDGNQSHPALGQLVLENDGAAAGRPRKTTNISAPTHGECAAFAESVELIGRLSLSRTASISALVRGVLLRAAGSSPAALAGCLERYRRLLLHARDAHQAGRTLERATVRRFTAELGDQLIWWELLPAEAGQTDLELSDLAILDEIIPRVTASTRSQDHKLQRLSEILREDIPTLVFTASRDTVRYIRDRLGDLSLAWCTGDRAGIRHSHLPRETVLAWFRKGGIPTARLCHLIVTDVAAEGLDLQRAARVVHYDLPWTPMRLEQREGRSARLGSTHPEIEVLQFATPPSLERSLRLEAALTHKARLPAKVGLGATGRSLWRWRADLAAELGGPQAVAGIAKVASPHRGLVAGLALHRSTDEATCLSAAVGWLDYRGTWIEDAEVISDRLREAARQTVISDVSPRLGEYLDLLTPVLRQRLALARGGQWLTPEPSPSVRILTARLGELIRKAARHRRADELSELERGLRFVAGGHTAGEKIWLQRLATAGNRELMNWLRGAGAQPEWAGIEVRLTGLIVFGP